MWLKVLDRDRRQRGLGRGVSGSKFSHRLVCTEPQVIRGFVHSCESKVRSLGSAVSVNRSDLLRFAAVTRWAAGQV
jgi:hypothetical protein